MTERNLRKSNRRVTGWLSLWVVGMFGFGYALVPLYSVFCEITGLNGKSATLSEASAAPLTIDKSRTVTVEFTVNVSGIPWRVDRPETVRLNVHPGEATTVIYEAHSLVDAMTAGQAVPSVTPAKAARHFRKTECFCFTRQELVGGESKLMPVTFVVDPKLPAEVKTITLSYEVYPANENLTNNS
ncbi:cytochrome c oxidase assembly protein [Gammaproteobacteria bacterium]|jgi:cytochrome c oxidase assembly protein subunit 11|nr:cytochrome c oxidase assembly protein [Gammaproteobacteria bacterium]